MVHAILGEYYASPQLIYLVDETPRPISVKVNSYSHKIVCTMSLPEDHKRSRRPRDKNYF